VIACLRRRAALVLGEFGAGKTEVTIALALRLAAEGEQCAIVDLDIVTPYFRSRDARDKLGAAGVSIVAPGGEFAITELPAIAPEMGTAIRQGCEGERTVLVDVGGSLPGAHALAHLLPQLPRDGLLGLLVLNRNRPEGQADGVRRMLAGLDAMGVPVTHLVSNTHLCGATSLDGWSRGLAWARSLAADLAIPLLCAGVPETLVASAEAAADGVPLLPVARALRFPWEV
jgi:hypothetical protein